MSQVLSPVEIENRIHHLSHWQLKDNALERIYTGASYLGTVEKLNAIAQIAEKLDHHPDLALSWTKLTIRTWTHTANSVTELDFELAKQIDQVLAS
jgi:4a-hydroxytetrahydrobiopterin dehydratase